MSSKTIITVGLAIAIVAGGIYAWSEYNRGLADTGSMPVKETVTAQAIFEAFSADEKAATAKYVGPAEQVIAVSGTIRSIAPSADGRTNVTLETGDAMAGVACEFEGDMIPSSWKANDPVTIKGICTGMLLDIVIIRCSPVVSD